MFLKYYYVHHKLGGHLHQFIHYLFLKQDSDTWLGTIIITNLHEVQEMVLAAGVKPEGLEVELGRDLLEIIPSNLQLRAGSLVSWIIVLGDFANQMLKTSKTGFSLTRLGNASQSFTTSILKNILGTTTAKIYLSCSLWWLAPVISLCVVSLPSCGNLVASRESYERHG